jgi:hypothetical protein
MNNKTIVTRCENWPGVGNQQFFFGFDGPGNKKFSVLKPKKSKFCDVDKLAWFLL